MTNKHIDRTRILILAGIALLTGSHRHCRASSPDKTHLDFDDLPKNRDRHFHSPPMIRGKRKLEVGPLTATYDPEFTALRCHNISTECDTVFQIAGVGESETNAPNTIDSCEDYSIGTHRKDESIERMRVRSLDDGPLAVGKEVIVEAIVYRAVNTTGRDYPNADTLGHFFYTPNAHSRHWSYVNTTIVQVENTATVSQFVLSATFILQPGNGTQAVRLSYGYGEYAIHNCHRIGSYYDVDDLVFEVDHDLIRYPGFTYFATAYGLPSTPPVWNTANYSSDFRVPRCQEYGTRCDTGSSLISGSGDFESNSPNSFTTCADAPTGTGQRYESIDRIRVFSMNGEYMTSGSWAQIFANVHIPTEINRTTADDYYHIAHFYHLSFVSGHNHWNYITSRFAKPDVETAYFTANFILPVGEHQMIRVIYGYGPATVGPCVKSWEYYDVDDLIFRVVQPLTSNPTRLPTSLPTSHPTASPTNSPTLPPTLPKTFSPTFSPTLSPSNGPSNLPSAQPSLSPSNPKTWAAFDSHYNSPRCVDVVASCDTGDDLIAGVAEQEPNASNTIDGCEDFSSPSTHQVESIQRISIETVDGGEFAVGKEVEVKAFVRAASNTEGREYPGKKDVASFFYAANADTKDWYFITAATVQTDGEIHTIVARFMLQPGQRTQAIRLNFGYAEFMIHSCKRSSSFYDVDDLVFDVNHDMFPEPTFHYIPAVEEPYPPAETIRRFAIYDDDYTAPRCLELGSSCETGSTLVKKSSEYEQNTPNSVDECRDVSVSSEEVFESIEMVMVRSLNGGIMSVGSWVELFVMVKTPNRPRSPNRHHLAHFYYKTNVDPYWKYISSMFVLMVFENSSFLTKFKLPEGETHTIRVIYGYGELEIGPCVSGWEYMDVDDLVFSVAPAPPTPTSTPTLRPSASSLTFYDSSPPSKSPTSMMTTPLESPAPTPSPTILFRTTSPGISGSNSQRNFAEYDDLLKAPRCPLGSLCDSDVLLLGMNFDGIDGPEPNAPNTIDSCQQGESTMDLVTGTPVFRRDESVDRIVIRSVDGDTMKAGREVEAEITLYGAEDTSSRSNPDSRSIAHVYYTPNAGASGEIEWKYLWSESVDPGVGEHVFQVRFFLLSGKDIEATTSTQAVRVNYAYAQYNADSCFDDDFLDHPYVDVDDLAFEVQEYDATDDSEIDPSPTLAPTSTSSVDCNRTGTFIYFIVTVSIFAVVNEVLVA